VQIPYFPEANHPVVQSLSRYSDQELLTLFQRNPDQGRYFTTIFCRYTPIVYTLIAHSVRSPVQADYLFALTWRHIYYELGGVDLRRSNQTQTVQLTLQNWLINVTAQCINQAKLPPVESIHYSLKAAPPVLWCYVNQALDRIPPLLRLMTIMAQTFRWSETRIAAYLQVEGEKIAPPEVNLKLQEAHRALELNLPQDIRLIYFDEVGVEGVTELVEV
jgi:hypothetical protein